MEGHSGDSADWREVDRLTAALPRRSLSDPTALADAARTLGVVWPADYEHVISGHDGVEGDVGDWRLVLWPAEELVDHNTGDHMRSFAGLVLLGGDGAGEALALDRSSGEVLLVPLVGDERDWLVLGSSLAEALTRMDRGTVFEAPRRVPGG